jgi:hypothetical protein
MNVASFNNNIVVATIIGLEQDLELPKSMRRSKNMNLAINFKMFGWFNCMGRIYHQGGWFGEFCKVHSLFKVEGKEKKLTPKFDFMLKHSRKRKVTSIILWVKVEIF